MRVQILSDHGGQQLDRTVQQLQDAEMNVSAWHESYRQAQQELQASRRRKPWWRRLFGMSTADELEASTRTRYAERGVVEADFRRQGLDERVRQQAAGLVGEEALVYGLSGLDDSWVMLRGYRNRRGETDHVLVGPYGVWAVEVKRRRIRLHVVGEQWWYEKLSSRGNVVEQGWAVDAVGSDREVRHPTRPADLRANRRVDSPRSSVPQPAARQTGGRWRKARVKAPKLREIIQGRPFTLVSVLQP